MSEWVKKRTEEILTRWQNETNGHPDSMGAEARREARALALAEGPPSARRTGRTQCSVCQRSGKPWEFDDSGRCANCAP